MATLEILEERKKMTPRKQAIHDIRAEGLDTTVLRKIVIVEEVEEFVFRSIGDGITPKSAEFFLECRRVKRTIISETTHI